MRTSARGVALAAVIAAALVAGQAAALSNPNGMSFRAVGWFRGEAQISDGQIRCEIPTSQSGIAEGSFSAGIWNTFGEPFLYFPDINSAFYNPCGGYIQMQNNMIDQAINVDRLQMTYKIGGARRFRQFVPTRNGFPIACRPFRKQTIFMGQRINPINSTLEPQSGVPNIVFAEVLPLVNTQLINCLRSQYAPLPADVFSSLPLIIRTKVIGTTDSGDSITSNTLGYTLTLRHTCGNGRVDDGEICDPLAPGQCVGFCSIPGGETTGTCSFNEQVICRFDADCNGTCLDGNNPTECTCLY